MRLHQLGSIALLVSASLHAGDEVVTVPGPAWQRHTIDHKLRDAGWVMSLTPQDMDADGDMDVVFSDRKGQHTGVFWHENPHR